MCVAIVTAVSSNRGIELLKGKSIPGEELLTLQDGVVQEEYYTGISISAEVVDLNGKGAAAFVEVRHGCFTAKFDSTHTPCGKFWVGEDEYLVKLR